MMSSGEFSGYGLSGGLLRRPLSGVGNPLDRPQALVRPAGCHLPGADQSLYRMSPVAVRCLSPQGLTNR